MRNGPPPVRMLYERRIESFGALLEEASSMDADAGLRIPFRDDGRDCFAFVTRFGTKYVVMVYEKKGGREARLGKRIVVEELEGVRQLEDFLRDLLPEKVKAFAY